MKTLIKLFGFTLLIAASLFTGQLSEAKTAIPQIPASGKSAQDFIPKGWSILKNTTGDLNKDGQDDIAMAIKSAAEDDENQNNDDDFDVPRLLIIAFKTTDGGYKLSATSSEAILCKKCGGVFGDPFADLKIDRGSLLVNHYGGSRDRWGYTHRWRFQDGGWFLIGLTTVEEDVATGASKTVDTNLITGSRTTETTSAKGKSGKTSDKIPVKPLTNLKQFHFDM